ARGPGARHGRRAAGPRAARPPAGAGGHGLRRSAPAVPRTHRTAQRPDARQREGAEGVTDVFLGVIAGSVLVMALLQVAAVLVTARTVRRVNETVTRLEQDMRPIVNDLRAIAAETARATG